MLQNIFIQTDAPRDLSMISWPKFSRFPQKPKWLQESTRELVIIKDNKATQTDDSKDEDEKRTFHGSCVASKAIGETDGVSRTSQLTVFKIGRLLSDATWAFAAVRNTRTPIVVCPWVYVNTAPRQLRRDLSTIKDIISDILEGGGIIVVSAGNEQSRSALADTFPSTLEADSKQNMQPNRYAFIVAGAVRASKSFWNEAGSIAKFSQRSLLGPAGEYWAPGEAIRCAGPNGHQMGDGTSYAAPMVAGLIVLDGHIAIGESLESHIKNTLKQSTDSPK
ncbi:MAG: hypothetical protein Q9222_001921 [Ikaeria aurantiellina]